MVLRTSALWACLLLASASFAGTTHKIRKGETPEGIAKEYGVSKSALMKANPGLRETRLQIGQKLTIPTSKASSTVASKGKPSRGISGGGSYAVRNGDNDWTIARKFDLTTKQLHALNPSVRWSSLQVGQKLRVPGSTSVARAPQTIAVSYKSTGHYKVTEEDNDWIIARKLSITVPALHKLNPGVNWNRLRPGQIINAPGRPAAKVQNAVAINSKRVKVTRTDVNVRRKPSTQAELITQVDTGKVALVIDREGDWYKLRFVGGTEGWVRSDMLKPVKAADVVASNPSPRTVRRGSRRTAPSGKTQDFVVRGGPVVTTALIETAMGYQGVRYTWGGTTSRGGFDCSGFVGRVYRQHGVSLPRTSIEMSKVGQSVSREDLRQGDLLFFKTRNGSRVNHVGLYIGNGRFIHASSSGGRVMTESLTGYYSRRLAGAKRVTGKLSPSKRQHIAQAETPKPDEQDPVQEPKASVDEASVAPKKVQVGTDALTKE